jgi:RHS repeat-associated protein
MKHFLITGLTLLTLTICTNAQANRFDAETGLMYYKNRYHSTTLGRFISRDPIGYRTKTLNLYQYAKSSPVEYIDPYGLDEVSVAIVPDEFDDGKEGDGFEDAQRERIRLLNQSDALDFGVPVKNIEHANAQLKAIHCDCIKTLYISGHGNVGFINISSKKDPKRATEGRIGVRIRPGRNTWIPLVRTAPKLEAYGLEIFDGVNFCNPCKIILIGCKVGKGLMGHILLKAIKKKTGCEVEAFGGDVYSGWGLPGSPNQPTETSESWESK